MWVRHHVSPRLTAFAPIDSMPGGPGLQLLESVRETRFREVTSSVQTLPLGGLECQGFTRVDDWRAIPHYSAPLSPQSQKTLFEIVYSNRQAHISRDPDNTSRTVGFVGAGRCCHTCVHACGHAGIPGQVGDCRLA